MTTEPRMFVHTPASYAHDVPGDERHTCMHHALRDALDRVAAGRSVRTCPAWALAHLYGTGRIKSTDPARHNGQCRYALTRTGERDHAAQQRHAAAL